jgi:hypothetical protein
LDALDPYASFALFRSTVARKLGAWDPMRPLLRHRFSEHFSKSRQIEELGTDSDARDRYTSFARFRSTVAQKLEAWDPKLEPGQTGQTGQMSNWSNSKLVKIWNWSKFETGQTGQKSKRSNPVSAYSGLAEFSQNYKVVKPSNWS